MYKRQLIGPQPRRAVWARGCLIHMWLVMSKGICANNWSYWLWTRLQLGGGSTYADKHSTNKSCIRCGRAVETNKYRSFFALTTHASERRRNSRLLQSQIGSARQPMMRAISQNCFTSMVSHHSRGSCMRHHKHQEHLDGTSELGA